ncbi:MAG: class I SAM-dependent methyltransferase [Anaerolineae bacterium]|nr:class I SAM-dependent methyltransferase [Anaerolineae bacterium]MDW8097995.1 class I SAM-dependent methyltransferase [Anaerolineae bacterium]
MKPEIAQQLIQLNRRFYDQFADAFAASRPAPLPGVERLLAYVPDDSALLDVGCGHGQLVMALHRMGRRVRYIGVDASARLIEHARCLFSQLQCTTILAQFMVLDVTQPDWASYLPLRRYQVIALLALLHHIPGMGRRIELLHQVARCLAPDGVVLVSTWQFLHSERLRRRLQPWHLIGLHPEDVEPGDYLLDWQRDGCGLRYCAFIDAAALDRLAEAAGLRVAERFYAGQDDLNLCAVLRPLGHWLTAASF